MCIFRLDKINTCDMWVKCKACTTASTLNRWKIVFSDKLAHSALMSMERYSWAKRKARQFRNRCWLLLKRRTLRTTTAFTTCFLWRKSPMWWISFRLLQMRPFTWCRSWTYPRRSSIGRLLLNRLMPTRTIPTKNSWINSTSTWQDLAKCMKCRKMHVVKRRSLCTQTNPMQSLWKHSISMKSQCSVIAWRPTD